MSLKENTELSGTQGLATLNFTTRKLVDIFACCEQTWYVALMVRLNVKIYVRAILLSSSLKRYINQFTGGVKEIGDTVVCSLCMKRGSQITRTSDLHTFIICLHFAL